MRKPDAALSPTHTTLGGTRVVKMDMKEVA